MESLEISPESKQREKQGQADEFKMMVPNSIQLGASCDHRHGVVVRFEDVQKVVSSADLPEQGQHIGCVPIYHLNCSTLPGVGVGLNVKDNSSEIIYAPMTPFW